MWHRIKTFFTRVVQQILMRHSEQRERARALLEQVKRDGSTPTSPNKVSDVVDRLFGLWLDNLDGGRETEPASRARETVTGWSSTWFRSHHRNYTSQSGPDQSLLGNRGAAVPVGRGNRTVGAAKLQFWEERQHLLGTDCREIRRLLKQIRGVLEKIQSRHHRPDNAR